MRKLTKEEEQELVQMYKEVEKDFAEFPHIKTSEDLFRWREQVKGENKEDGELRNQIIEQQIKGNKSMELLYAWSKFTRMVDRSKAKVFLTKLNCDAKEESYQINASRNLHEQLVKNKKADVDKLFGIYKIEELGLGVKYPKERSFHTAYEYEKSLVTEDEEKSCPVVLFVSLMNAYGIESEDLLAAGRQTEKEANEYVADMIVQYETYISSSSPKASTYSKK